MSFGPIVARGLTAAHGALLGAFYLFLLHAPLQVLSAVAQGLQAEAVPARGQAPDPNLILLSLAVSIGAFLLALAMFFLFPLVLGGILGQVRDRLQSPQQPPGPFGPYGRAYYPRLLGNLGVFALVVFVIMLPVMCLGMGLAFQQTTEATRAMPAGADAPAQPPDPQQLTRQLLSHPAMLVAIVILSLLASAATMVYWVANSIVVSEQERVGASWRRALRFCRQHLAAILGVWFVSFAVGLLIAPFSLLGPLGIVRDLWVLAALGLVYAAFLGYWGVLLAGLVMSLYLARRSPPAGEQEPGRAAVA